MCSWWCGHRVWGVGYGSGNSEISPLFLIWFGLWALEHKDLSSSYFYSFLNFPGAEERARNEIAEKERELLKQKLQEQQQEMEAQKKSFQENIAQLTEKLEKEKENLLREMNMMLEHKMKVSQAVALVVLNGHYPGTSGRDGRSLQQDHGGSIIAIYCFWFIKTLRILPK